ncbi:putative translation initiation factor IF-2 [uncultured archaeon]|nr:putative translation initiation factor IF-2 [uncultured archaeon]
MAVLVIDINEGIKPQTAEVIKILKMNKTPFVIALNKIDNISGWRDFAKEGRGLKESIELQRQQVKQVFDERYMTLIGSLNSFGFDSDLFFNINDFTQKIGLVPCSAMTKEGIPELIMVICGLSQRYLMSRLKLGEIAKGVLLEVKKEKTQHFIEAILYDGELKKDDEIAVASFDGEPMITKIRVLEEIEPLCNKFSAKEKVTASTGIRMQLIEKIEILPGLPFIVYKNNKNEIREIFKKELLENIKTDKQGIIAKADSLGSLEALLVLLREKNINIVKAGIGDINKKDLISAKANLEINELDAIIVGFNVSIDEEAQEFKKALSTPEVKIITNEVIYRLIDDVVAFRVEKQKAIEKKRLMGLSPVCKLRILPQYVFRNTNPAIFGVRIEGGRIVSDLSLIKANGEKLGKIKAIQADRNSVHEANEGMEVAISISGVNFEREVKDQEFLYTDLGESMFRNFKKNKDLLTAGELRVLQEIAVIKRAAEKEDWGA